MKLSIIATPIGNLKDITLRAIEALNEADAVLCEDTRRTIKLLNHLNIKKPLISYHRHSGAPKTEYILNLLKEGKRLALVSDSGTPGISDPGNKLIEELLGVFGADLEIIPIPGASAVTALASVAGINMDSFVFHGFPPQKKGRAAFFKKISAFNLPVIIYESPYRLEKCLSEIAANIPDSYVVLGKELTKVFEKIYRGSPISVLGEVKNDGIKGEYVMIIKNKS